jgi:hypothetical protein
LKSAYQRVVRYWRNAEHVHCHSWGLAEYLVQYLRGRNDLKDRIARDYGIAGDNRIAGNYMFSSGELSLTESYRRGH